LQERSRSPGLGDVSADSITAIGTNSGHSKPNATAAPSLSAFATWVATPEGVLPPSPADDHQPNFPEVVEPTSTQTTSGSKGIFTGSTPDVEPLHLRCPRPPAANVS